MKKLIFFSVTVALMFILGACEKTSVVTEQELPEMTTIVVHLDAPAVNQHITQKGVTLAPNAVKTVSLFLVCENTPEKVFEFTDAKIGQNILVLTKEQAKIALAATSPAISVNFFGSNGEWLGETGAENVQLITGTNNFSF